MEIIGIVQNDIPFAAAGFVGGFALVFLFCGILSYKSDFFGIDLLCIICSIATFIVALILLCSPTYTITLDASEASHMEVEQRMAGLEYTTSLNGTIELILGEDTLNKWCLINQDLQPQNFLS